MVLKSIRSVGMITKILSTTNSGDWHAAYVFHLCGERGHVARFCEKKKIIEKTIGSYGKRT